jgi:formylglycine-generating enzyme required for sulfatase activity
LHKINLFALSGFLIFCICLLSNGILAGCFGGEKTLRKEIRLNHKNSHQDYPDNVRAVSPKAQKVYKNKRGFWEAEFEHGIIMIYIPSGEFKMGTDNGKNNEKSLRTVYLDGYWIGKYEVTFDQYDRFCKEQDIIKPDDEGWGRERRPVINVSWEDAMSYCRWLSKEIGCNFKLPTESQWEKAARGIDGLIYPWGNFQSSDNKANFGDSSPNFEKHNSKANEISRYTTPVGSYPEGSSPYGVLDMAGNVYEWCLDWYSLSDSPSSLKKNPQGPKKGSYRVLRGGSWYSGSRCLRTTFRTSAKPASRYFHIGFRLCLE